MAPKAKAPAAAKSKAKASPKSPLLAAAKGVIGREKLPSPAGTSTPAAVAKCAAPAVPAAQAAMPLLIEPACAYDGKPLDVKLAEPVFAAIALVEMKSLAQSTSADEQLPARMLLELVGDKDLTWANAAKSLEDGANFKKEVLEMDGATYVTRKSIERFEALGKLQPEDLRNKHPAAFAIAVYMDAIIWAAKEKLGMNEVPVPPPPAADEKPPEWPIMVGIKEIPAALDDALRWRRTPLFLCSGKASVVDTFFSYQCCSLVDAKWILNKVDIKKELDVAQMREELRTRLVSGLKFGRPFHISMSNSAVSMKDKYCSDLEFPEALFKNDLWFQTDVYSKVIRDEDLIDWPGAFPGKMKGTESFAFVTSDFNLESAREFLPAVLPYFADMAIIQVDPASIAS